MPATLTPEERIKLIEALESQEPARHRRAMRITWASIAVATAVVGAVWWNAARNERAALVTQLLALSDRARTVGDRQDTATSILLAVEAFARDPESARARLTGILQTEPVGAALVQTRELSDPEAGFTYIRGDGRVLVSTEKGRFRILDGTLTLRVDSIGALSAVAFSPDGATVAVGAGDFNGRIDFISTSTWQTTGSTELGGLVSALTFGRAGGLFAVAVNLALKGSLVQIRSTESGEVISEIRFANASVGVLAFSPDERFLSTGNDDGTARLFDVRTGQELTRIEHREKATVVTLAFSPRGELLATGSTDATTRLTTLPKPLSVRLPAHYRAMTRVVFSPTANVLAAASEDGEIRLYDLDRSWAGVSIRTNGGARQLVFSPDGLILASAGDDGARLIDTVTQRVLLRLEPGAPVSAVAFSGSGDSFTLRARERIRVFRIPSRDYESRPDNDRLKQHACALAGRTLTVEERAEFLRGEHVAGCGTGD